MHRDELVDHYPTLFHMASAGSWPAIRTHGLWTTRQMVATSGGAFEDAALTERRAKSLTAEHPTLGRVTIRDQAPLRLQFLESCLTDMTIAQWLDTLNNRVFFWLHPDKLGRLLGARLYRSSEQDVLVIDTKSLLDAHEERVRLSPVNSGATLYPNATERGSHTFTTIEGYPYTEHRRKKTVREAVTELAVIDGVHDIRDHIIRVERRRGQELLECYTE
ncbi:hypothetical protein A5761_10115 [Mycolicibacterium setense]|uniref:DUF7002 family protein n=1 Tax=Mycolicibacterium setense TaxID=431269 RepID=UPI0007EA1A9B|nr:hypothetical protein [Mycolicibacterium setense]OBB17697.1 hypothetical protein A5761_10115 [Mycolicibacterium setense]